jgi:hypothetical protein
MKMFLILAALAGLGFIGFKVLTSGAVPRASLTRVLEVPGAAISQLSFSGGNPAALGILIGGIVLVLAILYFVLVK